MNTEERLRSRDFYNSLKKPILILSSQAGRGNTSIAEAIAEQFFSQDEVFHFSIEDFLSPASVQEDLVRYKFISNRAPLWLAAIYSIPFFYYRKLLREKLKNTHLDKMHKFLEQNGIATIVAVSHRQAFWVAVLKRNASLSVALYGVLTEYGPSLGWKYIFWNNVDGLISPITAKALRGTIPDSIAFTQLPLPARSSFYELPVPNTRVGDCLLIGGLWGQGRLLSALQLLRGNFPEVHVHVICGDNEKLARQIKKQYAQQDGVTVYGLLTSIEPLLSRCSSVVTKPGMGTLLEAHAANRKLFLFKGMPVAETQNARYALRHFNAEWLSVSSFSRWRASLTQKGSSHGH